jgi:putative restriction endonuclease
MTLTLLERIALEDILRSNGFHNEREVDGGWVAADASYAPGRCFVGRLAGETPSYVVATSLAHVAAALRQEACFEVTARLPIGAVAGFTSSDDNGARALTRRIFQLSKALPSAPLKVFEERLHAQPCATEIEAMVRRRVGQDVFRDALLDYWSGACAVTRLNQPEMLRASHIKPWSDCESDAERLDVYNGLLLAAHWDAAFDKGLVTFDEDGSASASSLLGSAARSILGLDQPSTLGVRLSPNHEAYLDFHRRHVFKV